MAECPFCKIASGEIDSDVVRDGERVFAFRDINPQAPTHILMIPKEHIGSVADLRREHGALLAEIFEMAGDLAKQEGIDDSGYRIVTNRGAHAGQSVLHLHFHLLGGRRMAWPPG